MNLLKFQKPTRYINREVNSCRKEASLRVALAFPDTYEIGMSHLGLKILYKLINSIEGVSCERVFAPDRDMAEYLLSSSNLLCSLESGIPLREFHLVGFSLQYELSYTTVLRMLRMGGIPLMREDRRSPIVVAGGPCTVNPVILEDFIDLFLVGDGEEAVVEMVRVLKENRDKESFLRSMAAVEGFYVPGYSKEKTRRRYLTDLENAFFPTDPPVPYTQIVHDRVSVEIARGCTRGCRFCQAGMFYRPLRERSPERVLEIVEESLARTGYDEVSLLSLDVGDYRCLLPLLREFNRRFGPSKVSVSLPSIRVGAVNREILKEIKQVKKSGFTIAPEAATERLRRVINKDFTQEEYDRALEALFSEGWLNLKLYFMVGLPTETEEDVLQIPEMVKAAIKEARRYTKRFVNITLSVSSFVPKPFTPFQWCGQLDQEALRQRLRALRQRVPKGVTFKAHDIRMSMLEAALSRGTGELSALIKEAEALGAYLDGWSEYFDYSVWQKAMDKTGIDLEEIATRTFGTEEALPWDFIDIGIKKTYLRREYERAFSGEVTTDCNIDRCHACGLGCSAGQFLIQSTHLVSTKKEQFSLDVSSFEMMKPHRFSPVKVRIEYEKRKEMRYLSTLEVMNTMLRAIRRAGVRIAYTEGFSPSPKVSMGPALMVGIESLSEYMDIEIYPPFERGPMLERINNQLPEGLKLKRMVFVHKRVPSLQGFISTYEYEVNLQETSLKGLKFFNLSSRGPYSEFILKFDIINQKKVFLRLRDLKDRKVRLREVMESLFDLPVEDLSITRTAQKGHYRGRWVDPVELIGLI